MFGARAIWLCGAGLVGAGLALLLYFLARLLWQFGPFKSEAVGAAMRLVDDSLLGLLPALPLAPPTGLQIAMFLGLSGVVLASLGVLIARRQAERISLERSRAEDRLRRVYVYRDSGRVEPFIGAASRERKRA